MMDRPGLIFKDEGDQLRLPPMVLGDPGFTVELWLRTKEDSDGEAVVFGVDGGDSEGPLVCSLLVGRPAFRKGGGPPDVASGPALSDGRPHHVAWVFGLVPGRVVIFVDFMAVGEVSDRPLSPSPRSFVVGGHLGHGAGFSGLMSQLRVWDRPIDPDGLKKLARGPVPNDAAGLVLNLNLDGSDAQLAALPKERWFNPVAPVPIAAPAPAPVAAPAPAPAPAPVSVAPPLSESAAGSLALRFRGSTADALPLTGLSLASRSFTVEAWVWPELLTFPPGQSQPDRSILGSVGPDQGRNSVLHLVLRSGRPYLGFFYNDLFGKTQLAIRQWVHIAWAYDIAAGKQSIYVNGCLDAETVGHAAISGTMPLFIGNSSKNTTGFTGFIRDLRIWDHARSASALLSNLWQTLPPDAPGLLANHPLSPGDPLCAGLAPERWAEPELGLPTPGMVAPIPGPVALFQRGDNAQIDGVGPRLPSDRFTVEAWLRADVETAEVWQSPVLSQLSSAGGWELRASKGRIAFVVAAPEAKEISFETQAAGAWLHVAGSWDGKTMALWCNGQLVAERELAGPFAPFQGPLVLGSSSSTADTAQFEGALAGVALWREARDATQLGLSVLGPIYREEGGSLALMLVCTGDSESPLLDVGPQRRPVRLRGVETAAMAPATWAGHTMAWAEALHDIRQQRDDLRTELERLSATVSRLESERVDLLADLSTMKARLVDSEAARGESEARGRGSAAALQALQDEVNRTGAPMALSTYLQEVSKQVGSARQALEEEGGFQLGKVSLDLKVLPAPGGARISFPEADAIERIGGQNLSSLHVELDPVATRQTAPPDRRAVPSLVGLTESYARELLGAQGLGVDAIPTILDAASQADRLDRVAMQQPAAGASVPASSTITLFIGTAG